jgi:hypothetical protein
MKSKKKFFHVINLLQNLNILLLLLLLLQILTITLFCYLSNARSLNILLQIKKKVMLKKTAVYLIYY